MTTKTRPSAKRATFVVRRERADGDAYSMTIAANDVSRNPFDEIRMDGGRFDNYLRNPVVLWSHDDSALPIGRTTRLHYEDGRLRADFEFLPDDPMAERVKRAWDMGFVNAASIRFMPLEIDTSDTSKPFGVVSEWDLLEWSLVPIPADPDALRAAARALNVPEEVLRQEHDEMVDEPMPEEEEEEPTIAELAARLKDLEERESAFDEDIAQRVERLEHDGEEESDEEPSETGAGEEPEDEEARQLAAGIESLLRDIKERI